MRKRVAEFLRRVADRVDVRTDYGFYYCMDCGEPVGILLEYLYDLKGKCQLCASGWRAVYAASKYEENDVEEAKTGVVRDGVLECPKCGQEVDYIQGVEKDTATRRLVVRVKSRTMCSEGHEVLVELEPD